MRELGVLQRAGVQGDRARLFAPCVGNAAVQSPERRELRIADRLVQRIGRASERGGGLREIVLEQPGFGKNRTDGERIFAGQRPGAKDGSDDLGRLGPSSTFERSLRTPKEGLHPDRLHGREYTKYPPMECVAN